MSRVALGRPLHSAVHSTFHTFECESIDTSIVRVAVEWIRLIEPENKKFHFRAHCTFSHLHAVYFLFFPRLHRVLSFFFSSSFLSYWHESFILTSASQFFHLKRNHKHLNGVKKKLMRLNSVHKWNEKNKLEQWLSTKWSNSMRCIYPIHLLRLLLLLFFCYSLGIPFDFLRVSTGIYLSHVSQIKN